jgi:CPA1 family monovalent cation:H+ antiporter
VDDLEFLILLLVAAAGLVRLADLVRVPYPIVLVLGGLAIGFVPGLPDLKLPPDVVFLVFLPPLLVAAGYLGWHGSTAFDADVRLSAVAFWEVLEFALQALIFVLLGTQFPALGLRNEGRLRPDVLRQIERDLDLEEARIA